jgi:sulfite reductase beta subunit-like hemoprotein
VGLSNTPQTARAYNIYLREPPKESPTLGKLIQRGINVERLKLALANIVEAYLNSRSKVIFSEYYSTKEPEEIQKIIC